MESMLCLGKTPAYPIFSFKPSTLFSRRENTKLHFRLHHPTSLSLAGNNCRPLGHVFRPVIHAVDKSSITSGNEESSSNIAIGGTVRACLVLACALGIIPAGTQVKAYPLSGSDAFSSLREVIIDLDSDKLEHPVPNFEHPGRPSATEVNKIIKKEALWMMKYGNPEDAVNFLQIAYNMFKGDPEPAYNLEMALVEILICQGKYREALECECLRDPVLGSSDNRPFVYKAIIYTMLGEKQNAVKSWKKYKKSSEQGLLRPG